MEVFFAEKGPIWVRAKEAEKLGHYLPVDQDLSRSGKLIVSLQLNVRNRVGNPSRQCGE